MEIQIKTSIRVSDKPFVEAAGKPAVLPLPAECSMEEFGLLPTAMGGATSSSYHERSLPKSGAPVSRPF